MIFVIGNLRSGTSRIAESLHQDFNVHMGRAFSAQAVGYGQRPDWEEINLSLAANTDKLSIDWMSDYVTLREKWLRETRQVMAISVPDWGVKCCAMMRRVDMIPESATVIYANRKPDEAKRSAVKWMESHRPIVSAAVLEFQDQLSGFCDVAKSRASIVIDYSESMDRVRKRLGKLMGVS